MNTTQLFSQNIQRGVRNITNYVNNGPRLRRTKLILSNGATVDYWTAMPYNKIWRAEVDSISNPPEYEFDSIEAIQKKRTQDLAQKFTKMKKK